MLTLHYIEPTLIEHGQIPVYLAPNKMDGLKGRVTLQMCEIWRSRHYTLHCSHPPWSCLRQRTDILGSYSLLVIKVLLPHVSTTYGP